MDSLKARCRAKAREHRGSNRYCGETQVTYLFALERKERGKMRPSVGAAKTIDRRDCNLVFDCCSEIATEHGLSLSEAGRLSAPLENFVKELKLSVQTIMENLSLESRSVIRATESFSLAKSLFLPRDLIVRNDELTDFPLVGRFMSLFRRRGKQHEEPKLVEEYVEFNKENKYVITYTDHNEVQFSGIAFFDRDQISAVLHRKVGPNLSPVFMTIFCNPISDDEHAITLNRSVERWETHTYRCIGIPRPNRFDVLKDIGPTDIKQIRYYYALDNTNDSNSGESSFSMYLNEMRQNLVKGIGMQRYFIENEEEFKNLSSTKQAISRIEGIM